MLTAESGKTHDVDDDIIDYDDEDSYDSLAEILGNKVMDFAEGPEKPMKPSKTCNRLEEVIKFVKTKYVSDYEKARESRKLLYREKCMKALG